MSYADDIIDGLFCQECYGLLMVNALDLHGLVIAARVVTEPKKRKRGNDEFTTWKTSRTIYFVTLATLGDALSLGH